MRRVSMAVLSATARHVLRGLDIIGPQAMHTHVARRARSSAAAAADHDEFRYARRDEAFARDFQCEGVEAG